MSAAVTAFAPGSIGNVGPGLDILGLAVAGDGDAVRAEWLSEPGIRMLDPGHPELPREAERHTSGLAARAVLRRAGDGATGGKGIGLSVRKGLHAILTDLLPQPLVTVTGPGDVDVVPRRVGKQLRINLCNTGGPHVSTFTWDQLPPVGPLTLSVRLRKAPKAVRLEPEGKALRCRYAAGRAHIDVPAFAIHSIVTIDA